MKPEQIAAIERFKEAMVRERLAAATRDQYLGWARRFAESNSEGTTREDRVAAFLSTLSTKAVATQHQALNALAGKSGLFALLGKPLGELPSWVNARRPKRVKTWVTAAETEAIMTHLEEPWSSIVGLLFGSGLRIYECMSLRWRSLDFERGTVTIHEGKGKKDRVVALSARLLEPLLERRERCRALWEEDRAAERPGVSVPDDVGLKSPRAGEEWPFFWVYPAAGESEDPESGIVRRHHVHEKSFSRPVKVAVRRSRVAKRVTAHTFRHGFATLYLMAGGNLSELQRVMGHESIETTQDYLHCLPQQFDRIGSPWDVAPPQSGVVVPFQAANRKVVGG